MKIFVTGHRGYIGTHLVELLQQEGHFVTGCDVSLFDGCQWGEDLPRANHEHSKDIRSITTDDLRNQDCVMHLAALSNDPMGALNSELTRDINLAGSIQLARFAKQAGVSRFLFASSCSIYGMGSHEALDEQAPTAPLSVYAESKVEAERMISQLADDHFSPSYLRNATAFGHSPMLRLDLVANNLLASAWVHGEVRIMSDGMSWRPLIHARDIAKAFVGFLHAPREVVHNRAVNIGSNTENYRVKEIAECVQTYVPEARIIYTGEVGHDPRNYRVNFDLLGTLLPHFKLEYTLAKGLEALSKQFSERKFHLRDFEGDQFFRLRTLKKRLHRLEFQRKLLNS